MGIGIDVNTYRGARGNLDRWVMATPDLMSDLIRISPSIFVEDIRSCDVSLRANQIQLFFTQSDVRLDSSNEDILDFCFVSKGKWS